MGEDVARSRRRALVALSLVGALGALTSCSSSDAPGPSDGSDPKATSSAARQDVVHVPQDASLAEAGDLVAPGGIILIAAGTYTDTLDVRVDDVTVRGADRNGVVLDGELKRSHGVVATGARVAIENLTVRNYLQNGVLVTGVTDENGAGVARGPDGYLPTDIPDPVPGYLVQYVTAQNNGLYGIYAFNRTGGILRDNLASGGSDSGIYVGQCADCNAVVQDNVLQWNAVGLELANASNVTVTGNRVVDNRVGVSVLSNYLEGHGPTRGLVVAGNVLANNNAEKTPEQAAGGFGIGIGLGGTVDADVHANLISGNRNVGVWVTSSEDFAPTGTSVRGNRWTANGQDVVLSPNPDHVGSNNCFSLPGATSAVPDALLKGGCGPFSPGDWSQPTAPGGIAFSTVATPPERAGLAEVGQEPRTVPDRIDPPDTRSARVPAATLLERDR